MKCLIAVALILGATLSAFAETNEGVAFVDDAIATTNRGDVVSYSGWVAGTETGPLLHTFQMFFPVNGPPPYSYFAATKINSFVAYRDPFFGKVVDFWLEGLMGSTTFFQGQMVKAHFRLTESEFPGKPFGYMTVDLFLPNSSTPIFSRIGFTDNLSTNLLVPDDAGVKATDVVSGKGMAYGSIKMSTNRSDTAYAGYRVANNFLWSFSFSGYGVFFHGTGLRSFACDTNGLFGKQAEFWLDGLYDYVSSGNGTPTVAHVIVTDSAFPGGLELFYIAIYLRGYLSTPIYERLGFLIGGSNSILCK